MPTSEEIKANQATIWSHASPAWVEWDATWERFPGPVNEWLCAAADLKPGMNVLDLASGVGQPAVAVAVRVAPGGKVTATDIAPGMVDMLRQRIERDGIANLEAVLMDMEKLEFPDESFDAVTARWAFMFAPDTVGAMAAARRVLKPGGRLTTAPPATGDAGLAASDPAAPYVMATLLSLGLVAGAAAAGRLALGHSRQA